LFYTENSGKVSVTKKQSCEINGGMKNLENYAKGWVVGENVKLESQIPSLEQC
jgi:hypothetical protein